MANISNKLAPHDVATRLNDLAKDHAAWNNGAYKTSNSELYALLDRCFTLLEQMTGQRKLIAQLNNLLTASGIKFNDGTSLETKIARFVFNGDSKRITLYARNLRIVAAEKAENQSVADFITRAGGVEEVCKRKVAGVLTKAEQAKLNIKLAEVHFVTADSLVQDFACTAPEVHPGKDASHQFTAALLRKNDDGSFSIVYGCNKATVVKVLLAEGGVVASQQAAVNMVNADHKARREQRIAALAKPRLKAAA